VFSLVNSAFFRFLHDLGVPSDELGAFITKNPRIFQEDLNDLQVRVNYLQSKKFSAEMIARVVSRNPYWLSFRYSICV
jgi:mTERF domain-containing protein